MKLRVCSPSPQISILWPPESFASITLRQIAAGAFSRPAVVGAVRAVDVVVAGDPGLESEVLARSGGTSAH